jgi:hypothetical protein
VKHYVSTNNSNICRFYDFNKHSCLLKNGLSLGSDK